MKPIGVLLAAGRGRRMGGHKQLHLVTTPAGNMPLVAAAFDSIASVCRAMIVVVGHRAEEVIAVLGDREFTSVSADADAPMFHSVQVGLRAAQVLDPRASVLLQLGDHPQVEPATLQDLLACAASHSSKAVLPEYQGQGGHPVWLPESLIPQVLSTECGEGLRGFWLDHPVCCQRLPVNDAAVVRDVDTLP